MKYKNLQKILMSSIAFLALSGAMAFAADARVVDGAGTSGTNNSTFAGQETDDQIVAPAISKSDLVDSAENKADSIKLLSDVDNEDFVTSLYYNENNVTLDAALYDADWNLETGFTTNTFAVGLQGTTSQSETLDVTVAATPFAIVDSTNAALVTAGEMSVTIVKGSESSSTGSQTATAYATPTQYKIKSDSLAVNTYYDPAKDSAYTPVNGVATGKVVEFTLSTVGKDQLPAGRYQSTVTLTYALQ